MHSMAFGAYIAISEYECAGCINNFNQIKTNILMLITYKMMGVIKISIQPSSHVLR